MTSTLHLRHALVAGAAVAMLAVAGCSTAGAETPAESAGATSGAAGASEWPDTITFAQVPSESSTAIAEQNEAIIAGLEQRLSEEAGKTIEVELQEATSYAAVIEALRAGQVQIGAMGPFSYVVAADGGAGVEPLGALADSADEAGGYQSYGIVPAGSDITDLAGFAGKTVCFVDPTSTSGFLFPSAGLLEEGIDPETGVEPVFAGGHDASALSVANGTCDAGFAFDAIVDSILIESGQLEEGALETIWKSEIIPSSPFVVSTQLPEDLQETIRTIFLEDLNKPGLVELGVCSSEEECVLPEETEYGFVPVDDSLYDGIRAVCEVTQSDSCVA